MRKFLAGAVAISLLVACGGGGGGGPEDAVAGFFDALKAGDIDKVMEYVPEAEREEITDEDREAFQMVAGMMSEIEYTIVGSEVEGDQATVTVEITFMGETEEQEIHLQKESGGWVISEGAGGAFGGM